MTRADRSSERQLADESAPTDPATRALAPLYARLPRGPHHLGRTAVLLNQRKRIQGAFIEAVVRDGYERTNVTRVIRLAGVSRRAFYEQFANREDCLVATFEEILGSAVASVRGATPDAGSGGERSAAALVGVLATAVERDPSAAALVICHAETAGRHGVARVRRAAVYCERLLLETLWAGEDAGAPPAPIVRAIVGGVHGILHAHLQAPAGGTRHADGAVLERELRAWVDPLSPAIEDGLSAAIAAAGAASLREAVARGAPPAPRPRRRDCERERLLRAVLRLAVLGDYLELTAAQIADEAAVPTEAFFTEFADLDACYAAAQERLAVDLLAALDAVAPGEDWATSARLTIEELLRHLCQRPLCAHTLARGAFTAGAAAVQRNRDLSLAVAARVLQAAPGARGEHSVEAIAGALWHTIGCQVAGGRTQLLPALRDHLAYVVLAPPLGSDDAARALMGDLDPPRRSRSGSRSGTPPR